jgi:hypothetical protein
MVISHMLGGLAKEELRNGRQRTADERFSSILSGVSKSLYVDTQYRTGSISDGGEVSSALISVGRHGVSTESGSERV